MRRIALLGALVLMASTALLAQKTSFDFDRTADFSALKTYALVEGTPVGDALIDNRIVAAINAQLAARGMTVDAAKPDVKVAYHIAFDKQQNLTSYSTGGGYYRWGGGWGTTDVRVNEILVGTLVIDIARASTNDIVWRGIGVKEVDVQAKADKRDKNITNAVTKILKNFPPKPKS